MKRPDKTGHPNMFAGPMRETAIFVQYTQFRMTHYSRLLWAVFRNTLRAWRPWVISLSKKLLPDGNGRLSRLIMNYQLMVNGFLPVPVAKENRPEYYKTLEEYALNGNL